MCAVAACRPLPVRHMYGKGGEHQSSRLTGGVMKPQCTILTQAFGDWDQSVWHGTLWAAV
eukprot:6185495-Pleurochrysis_carterae.AAC.3